MKKVILAVSLSLAAAAHAGERNTPVPSSQLWQQQLQGQAQGQSAEGGAGGAAAASNSFKYDGDRNPVNSAFGYAPPPTADCQATFGAGGQGITVGLSFSGSYDDSECNKRAWAAWLVSVKREKEAMQVSCTSKYVKDTEMCTGKKAE